MYSLIEFSRSYRSKGSQDAAKVSLAKFFEMIYHLTPPRYRKPDWYEMLDSYSLNYLEESRDYSKDLLGYVWSLDEFAPKTVQKDISFVKLWLENNDIELKKSSLNTVHRAMPISYPISEEDEISPDILKRMMSHTKQPLKSIILVMLSSGMRIGECLSLDLADLNLESEPTELTIRAKKTKTKKFRYTFISSEARSEVREWLRIRDSYMITARKRWTGSKPWDECPSSLVFPFAQPTINSMLRTVLKKSDLFRVDDTTRHMTIHSHMFRKFFISQLKAGGMNEDMAEMLAGHVGPYQGAYQQYTKEQVKKTYLQAEYAVSLNAVANMPKIRADLEQSKETQQALASELIRLRADMGSLARGDPDVIKAYQYVGDK